MLAPARLWPPRGKPFLGNRKPLLPGYLPASAPGYPRAPLAEASTGPAPASANPLKNLVLVLIGLHSTLDLLAIHSHDTGMPAGSHQLETTRCRSKTMVLAHQGLHSSLCPWLSMAMTLRNLLQTTKLNQQVEALKVPQKPGWKSHVLYLVFFKNLKIINWSTYKTQNKTI